MASLEVPLKDDGSVGTLPEQLQKFLDAKISEAFGKGTAKAAEEAKAQIDAERAKLKMGHAEAERLKTLEAEASQRKEQDAIKEKDFAEAQRIRDERHAAELKAKDDATGAIRAEVDKRDARIRQLAASDIKVQAAKLGARAESLEELEALLSTRIGIGADLAAFVKGADAQPALDKDGKPLSIEGLVRSYLTDHPHHLAGPKGTGGRANGGRSLNGQTTDVTPKGVAFDRVREDPSIRSVAAALAHIG